MDAMADIIMVTLIEVGSYAALNNGKKGIGKRAQSQRPLTRHSNFHLLRARFFNIVENEVRLLITPTNSHQIDLYSHNLTWLL